MIKISFLKNSDGIYTGFKALGHAGYANNGQDIVCSAVSALIINTINSIETFTSDEYTLNTDEDTGLIEFRLKASVSDESVLLLKSLILGLQGIIEDNKQKYIKLTL